MRNKAWYLLMLKGKTVEWAYNFIKGHLERPSFVYEPQNAYAAFKEVFGFNYISPQEMKAAEERAELDRLRAENEALRMAAQQKVVETVGQSEIEPMPDEAEKPIIYQTKDEFMAAHPELKAPYVHKVWNKYAKENGLVK